MKKHQISLMAEHYSLDKRDLHGLAKHMDKWTGHPEGVDRKGLYEITTENPDGRWDWYKIGGRWGGYIEGANRNVIAVHDLLDSAQLKEQLPYYLLVPGARCAANGPLFAIQRK